MANDRIYLRCKECGETLYFAKWYPGSVIMRDGIAQWINEHVSTCTDADMFLTQLPFEWMNEEQYLALL